MKMTRFFILLIVGGLDACYAQQNGLQKNTDFNKEIKASTISFFGAFDYDLAENGKVNFVLLFRNDSLKYISAGKKSSPEFCV